MSKIYKVDKMHVTSEERKKMIKYHFSTWNWSKCIHMIDYWNEFLEINVSKKLDGKKFFR